MEGAAVSQIAAKNGVPCVILRAMSDNADEDGHEVLVVKKFSITEYVATATKIVAAMVESLVAKSSCLIRAGAFLQHQKSAAKQQIGEARKSV